MLHEQVRDYSIRNSVQAMRDAPTVAVFGPERRAELLEKIAASLEANRDAILQTASAESSLTIDELTPEFARMTGTLRLFADLIRDPAWTRPAISARLSEGQSAIGPNHDVRSMLVPLGPVLVFGASNFPLAYGVCGGDTASALAAGCPVIVKEHPAHPRTGRVIFHTAQAGIRQAGVDAFVLGYVEHTDPRDLATAEELIRETAISAVGFTGSRRGGEAIERIARERPLPIPVFAEMGSANPVLITPRALRTRGEPIAHLIADSILARFGQQCTCPGIIVVPEAAGEGQKFSDALAARINAAAPRRMLTPWIRDSYLARAGEVAGTAGVKLIAGSLAAIGDREAAAMLLESDQMTYGWHGAMREEIFGPAALVVRVAGDGDDAITGMGTLPLAASLTLSLFFEQDDPTDIGAARSLLARVGSIAGRLLFNGVPTGVRVAPGIVHGGPMHATNSPQATAVGPRAIERWCRPMCWQNCPEPLLPPELVDRSKTSRGASVSLR